MRHSRYVRAFGQRAAAPLAMALALGIGCSDSVGTGARVASMRIMSAPTSLDAGEPFGVTVELLAPDGTVATNASNEVTLGLVDAEVTINGVTSVTSDGGVATFTNLAITTAGTNHQLVAGSAGVSAGSATFDVTPGPPAAGQSSVSPPPGNVPPSSETFLTFLFKDAFGNAVRGGLPVALASSLAGATFVPSAGMTSAEGSFETLFLPKSAGSATLMATVDATPITIATPFVSVDLCPAPVAMTFPGSVVGRQPCGAYVPTSIAPSLFSFTSPGGGAAFTITAAFDAVLQLLAASDEQAIAFVNEAEDPTSVEWLLAPGSYLFRVATLSSRGDFVLSGATVAGNSAGVARALLAAGEYSGQSLSIGDFQFGDGSFFDVYYFFSVAPCRITLRSSAFNRYMIVADAITGLRLSPDRASTESDVETSLYTCRGGQTNPIVIIANSIDGGETGAYTLEVESLPMPPTSAIVAGDASAKKVKPVRLNVRDLARIIGRLKRDGGT